MMGIEKIIKEDKKVFYTIIIAFTFLVSFYFAYPLAIIIAIYGIILAILTYRKEGIKKIIKVLLKTLCYSLLGIMISCVTLLPTIFSIINSQRTAGNVISSYTITYYRSLANSILQLSNSGFWVVIGTQSIIFITLPLTIMRKSKEDTPIVILFFVLCLPLLIPLIGSIFMGFSFPNNRWTFAFPFIFAVITASFLNSDYKFNKNSILVVLGNVLLFLIINSIFDNSLGTYMIIQLAIMLILIFVFNFKDNIIKFVKRKSVYNTLLILIIAIGIAFSMQHIYTARSTYISKFIPSNTLNKINASSENTIPDFKKAINYIQDNDKGFYGISKLPYNHENVSILYHYNSSGYFFSILPKEYTELNLDINNSTYDFLTGFREFDYRTKINTLMGNKYLISYKGYNVPYGYSKVNDYKGKSKIYVNDYKLPFGMLYNNYITESEYDKLSSLEKESSLLKATVLEDAKTSNLKHFSNDYSKNITVVESEVIDNNKIFETKNKISIKDVSKATFKVKFEDVKNSEIYLVFDNLKLTPFTKEEMINSQLNDEMTEFEIEQQKYKYKWYQPSDTYKIKLKFGKVVKTRVDEDSYASPYIEYLTQRIFNLGYYDEANGEITVTLSSLGNYTFDSLKVYAVSMDDYEEDIENLRKSNFEVTDYGNGYLNGTVNAEEKGVLQFQTFYNKGWKVYVDDKEVETLRSNKYFLGINIGTGKHDIRLEYKTPYLKEGIVVSFAGIAIFITVTIINKKKIKS